MAILAAVLGWALLGLAAILANLAANLGDELRRYERRPVAMRRFATQPIESYRPEGWSILSRLRWRLYGAYVCGVIGILLTLYSCPKLGQ
jgi:hypothetical protein